MSPVRHFSLILLMLIYVTACKQNAVNDPVYIVNQSIKAHNLDALMNAEVSFAFRDRRYTATRTDDSYTYTRTWQENDTSVIADKLVNSQDFSRIVNGQQVTVADSMAVKYASSINSVLYFFQLPYLLRDPAANLIYEGEEVIKTEPYHVIQVTFDQAGGGEDFEDEFRYWFHQDSYLMDYLAYNYHSDGGGVRFRKAFNRGNAGEIITQDYINYEVPVGTPLREIPRIYMKNDLKELSRIVNQDIRIEVVD